MQITESKCRCGEEYLIAFPDGEHRADRKRVYPKNVVDAGWCSFRCRKCSAPVHESVPGAAFGPRCETQKSAPDSLPRQLVLDQIANEPAYPDSEDFLGQIRPVLNEHELTVEFVSHLIMETARLAVEDTKRCLARKIAEIQPQ